MTPGKPKTVSGRRARDERALRRSSHCDRRERFEQAAKVAAKALLAAQTTSDAEQTALAAQTSLDAHIAAKPARASLATHIAATGYAAMALPVSIADDTTIDAGGDNFMGDDSANVKQWRCGACVGRWFLEDCERRPDNPVLKALCGVIALAVNEVACDMATQPSNGIFPECGDYRSNHTQNYPIRAANPFDKRLDVTTALHLLKMQINMHFRRHRRLSHGIQRRQRKHRATFRRSVLNAGRREKWSFV